MTPMTAVGSLSFKRYFETEEDSSAYAQSIRV
jgi:hypothetical protein